MVQLVDGLGIPQPDFYKINSVIPHSAFNGQTPDEVYFGKGEDVPDQLAEARAVAREQRMEENRARQSAVCA